MVWKSGEKNIQWEAAEQPVLQVHCWWETSEEIGQIISNWKEDYSNSNDYSVQLQRAEKKSQNGQPTIHNATFRFYTYTLWVWSGASNFWGWGLNSLCHALHAFSSHVLVLCFPPGFLHIAPLKCPQSLYEHFCPVMSLCSEYSGIDSRFPATLCK